MSDSLARGVPLRIVLDESAFRQLVEGREVRTVGIRPDARGRGTTTPVNITLAEAVLREARRTARKMDRLKWTRDEFIDFYMARSGLPPSCRTEDGYVIGTGANGRPIGRVALPCVCGDERCQGWAMVPLDPLLIEDHRRFYGPRPGPGGSQ
jgi:hypothetical protein